jgi:hypothetical protein
MFLAAARRRHFVKCIPVGRIFQVVTTLQRLLALPINRNTNLPGRRASVDLPPLLLMTTARFMMVFRHISLASYTRPDAALRPCA